MKAMVGGGWRFPDEHQPFAHLIGHDGLFREMNVPDGQGMSSATAHVSRREAPDMGTEDDICGSPRAPGTGGRGPYPSDTVYTTALAGAFDSVPAMYHDQGEIAARLRGFNKGATVTTGLPVVFTTPAHGTAHDIIGQGIAGPGALESAVRRAARLATRHDQNAEETA